MTAPPVFVKGTWRDAMKKRSLFMMQNEGVPILTHPLKIFFGKSCKRLFVYTVAS
jgi:hypothetical protein